MSHLVLLLMIAVKLN